MIGGSHFAKLSARYKRSSSRYWRTIAPFVALFVLMVACAATGLQAIAEEADRSDAARAREAVAAAFHFQHKRLEDVTLNNAVYTAAAKAVGGAKVDRDWAIENWTVSPPELPGYHGILLIDTDGRPIIGTRAGKPLDPASLKALAELVMPVVARLPAHGAFSARGISGSASEPVLVAAANVVPELADRTPASMALPRRRLVLVNPLGPNVLKTMNETIGGDDLKIGGGLDPDNAVRFESNGGRSFVLSWRPRSPGKAAMARSLTAVAPIFLAATFLLLLALHENLASTHALASLASRDSLTGLRNHGDFIAEFDRRLRKGERLTLGLIDLDRFKLVNDTHGHPAGDDLLIAFARVLEEQVVGKAILGRMGGDEFAFAMDNADEADAFVCRVKTTIAPKFETNAREIKIKFSFGIATAEPGLTTRDLIAKADARLYANKPNHNQERRAALP